MATETVILNLPADVYARLRERAEQSQRSVEEELIELAALAVSPGDDLPSDLAEALASLNLLNDEALWRAARSHLPAADARRLERLHFKRQREGLTAGERETEADLSRRYERAMLLRAQAAALLKQRGHDVASLLAPE